MCVVPDINFMIGPEQRSLWDNASEIKSPVPPLNLIGVLMIFMIVLIGVTGGVSMLVRMSRSTVVRVFVVVRFGWRFLPGTASIPDVGTIIMTIANSN